MNKLGPHLIDATVWKQLEQKQITNWDSHMPILNALLQEEDERDKVSRLQVGEHFDIWLLMKPKFR